MSVTHGTATRNALCSAVATAAGAGGKLRIRDGSAVLLADIALSATPFAAPSGGAMALNGVPLSDTSADATGTAATFQVTDSSGTVIFSGNVTATGGGGDLTLDTVSIIAGRTVTVTSGSYTAPV